RPWCPRCRRSRRAASAEPGAPSRGGGSAARAAAPTRSPRPESPPPPRPRARARRAPNRPAGCSRARARAAAPPPRPSPARRSAALDPPDHEPVALVGLVVVGAEAHVRAGPAVHRRQQAHLLEALLHAARREQRRAREALGDQARGVVAEGGDGVVAALAVAGGEAVEHRLQARVLLAHLVDAVPALERRHPLGLRVAELEGAGPAA